MSRGTVLKLAEALAAPAGAARPDGLANPLRAYPNLARKLGQLRASGMKVAIGTDVGSPAHFQANGIWWELETWRRLGATSDEALTAATETGAAVLREPDWGRPSEGAHADFVLYRGQANDGPFDMARVEAVARAGVLFADRGKWVGPTEGSE